MYGAQNVTEIYFSIAAVLVYPDNTMMQQAGVCNAGTSCIQTGTGFSQKNSRLYRPI
jgi:hypothetical protein